LNKHPDVGGSEMTTNGSTTVVLDAVSCCIIDSVLSRRFVRMFTGHT